MISILILTKNEEQDLPGCLQSVSWSDDIHVFDSFSTDNTARLAIDGGANLVQRKFDGYASQRNAALTTVEFKYDWIFILDADERIPTDLVPILSSGIAGAIDGVNGFRIRRRDFLGKTWLKHAQISPYYIRLVRKGKAHYHREINEVLEVDGSIADMGGYFDHYPFSKGYSHWLSKHNQYSSMEAVRWVEENAGGVAFSWKTALLEKDFNKRRYHQKGIFYKLPGRPLIKWFYMVILRRAFLDGAAGITYATLQAIYEYFIILKAKEIINGARSN